MHQDEAVLDWTGDEDLAVWQPLRDDPEADGLMGQKKWALPVLVLRPGLIELQPGSLHTGAVSFLVADAPAFSDALDES